MASNTYGSIFALLESIETRNCVQVPLKNFSTHILGLYTTIKAKGSVSVSDGVALGFIRASFSNVCASISQHGFQPYSSGFRLLIPTIYTDGELAFLNALCGSTPETFHRLSDEDIATNHMAILDLADIGLYTRMLHAVKNLRIFFSACLSPDHSITRRDGKATDIEVTGSGALCQCASCSSWRFRSRGRRSKLIEGSEDLCPGPKPNFINNYYAEMSIPFSIPPEKAGPALELLLEFDGLDFTRFSSEAEFVKFCRECQAPTVELLSDDDIRNIAGLSVMARVPRQTCCSVLGPAENRIYGFDDREGYVSYYIEHVLRFVPMDSNSSIWTAFALKAMRDSEHPLFERVRMYGTPYATAEYFRQIENIRMINPMTNPTISDSDIESSSDAQSSAPSESRWATRYLAPSVVRIQTDSEKEIFGRSGVFKISDVLYDRLCEESDNIRTLCAFSDLIAFCSTYASD